MKSKLIFILFILLSAPAAEVLAQAKTILVIQSYHSEFPWDKSYKQGIREVMGSQYNIEFFEMDTKRLPKSLYQKRADLAWQKYMEVKPVLVILGDDNALKYLGSKFAQTKTRVVYLGINNNPRHYDMFGHPNITGVLERPLFKRSIRTLAKLIKIKKALVLFDSGHTSSVVFKDVFSGKSSISLLNIQTDIKTIGNLDQWKQTIKDSAKNNYDVILIGLYQTITDSSGKHVGAGEIINWTSKNTPVPLFAFWDFAVGKEKAIGGYVLVGKEQGRLAAEIALKMLKNNKITKVPPVVAENGRLLFSKSQLKKWGLDPEMKFDELIEYVE